MKEHSNIKSEFPILNQKVNEESLVYLDSAATTQKPQYILEKIKEYYSLNNANVHRGVHTLAERATQEFENARKKVARFINAKSTKEIVFTRGATTSLNWIARFAEDILQKDDEVIISILEHHSNIIPWQEACRKTGAHLKYVYLKDGEIDLVELENLLSPKTKFVSLAHVSNVLGCRAPIKQIAEKVHKYQSYLVVDGAQSVPHFTVDVQDLDCDFLVFSGHKMLAPTGIGVLYGKEKILEKMSPVEFGGEMIDFVYEQEANWKELPWKFEAGTPNIEGAVALGYAVDYLTSLGMSEIEKHEQELISYILPKMRKIKGIKIYGPIASLAHSGVIAFNIEGIHPHDVAMALDFEGIAVRAGHHCTQPLHRYLGESATVRASFYIYNTIEDCDKLLEALVKVKEFFNGTL